MFRFKNLFSSEFYISRLLPIAIKMAREGWEGTVSVSFTYGEGVALRVKAQRGLMPDDPPGAWWTGADATVLNGQVSTRLGCGVHCVHLWWDAVDGLSAQADDLYSESLWGDSASLPEYSAPEDNIATVAMVIARGRVILGDDATVLGGSSAVCRPLTAEEEAAVEAAVVPEDDEVRY